MQNKWHESVKNCNMNCPPNNRQGESFFSHFLHTGKRKKHMKERARGSYLRLEKWVQRSLACQVEGEQGDLGELECVERLQRPEKSRAEEVIGRKRRWKRNKCQKNYLTVEIIEKKQIMCKALTMLKWGQPLQEMPWQSLLEKDCLHNQVIKCDYQKHVGSLFFSPFPLTYSLANS